MIHNASLSSSLFLESAMWREVMTAQAQRICQQLLSIDERGVK
jgi:hypothetical protein